MSERLYWNIVPVVAVALFFTNLTNYLYQAGALPIQPYMWIAGYGLVSLPFALLAFARTGIRCPPLAIWCYGFGLVSLVWFFPLTTSATAFEELQVRVLSIAFILITMFVCSTASSLLRARQAIAIAVLIGVAINFYELFNPETFSAVLGRSAGLYVNPNQSGAALVLGMIVGLEAVRERYRLLFMLVVGLGVVTTFSRSSMLAWAIAFGLTCAVNLIQYRRIRGLTEAVLAAVAALAIFLSPGWTAVQARLEDESVLNDNVLGRLSSLSLGQFDDDSATERVEVATQAWDSFGDHPFLGLGTGASMGPPFDVGPHNIYLAQMVDQGLLGALVFPALILACTWGAAPADRPLALTFAIAAFFLGFFSHNLLSERYALVSYAVMASIAATSRPTSGFAGSRAR
jgi:hypothetical protein